MANDKDVGVWLLSRNFLSIFTLFFPPSCVVVFWVSQSQKMRNFRNYTYYLSFTKIPEKQIKAFVKSVCAKEGKAPLRITDLLVFSPPKLK